MNLILQTQILEYVVIIRCQGRIVSGDEVRTLQLEVEKLTHLKKRVVLQLAEVSYIDSAGLGALVRLFGVLRFGGGGLKLCQLSPFVLQVLQGTNLLGVIPTYASEREAIEAFSEGPGPLEKASRTPRTKIVCIDTTRHLSDARTLVVATQPSVVIYRPGTQTSESVIEKFRESDPNVQVLLLPSDFSTAEASQAGTELLNRVRSVLPNQ
jgi:anti-sigma B factor antagonist